MPDFVPLRSKQEAIEAMERVDSGDLDQEERIQLLRSVQSFIGRQAIDPEESARVSDERIGFGSDLLRRASGAAQVGLTIASGAFGEPFAGIRGLSTLVQGKGSDEAAEQVRTMQDAFSFAPRTATGEEMLQSLAVPFQALDDGADWIATKASFGNPFAAASIYTGLLGGLDIAGIKGGRQARLGRVEKRMKELQKASEELGIDLEPSRLAASVVESAKNMTPAVRAENAAGIRSALNEALDLQNNSAQALTDLARGTKTFVNVEQAGNFARQARQEILQDGFDLNEMPNVQKRLDELENLDTRSPSDPTPVAGVDSVRTTARVTDIETIRNRIEKQLISRKDRQNLPATTRENLALTQLEGKMSNWLDQQFNSDMITGDPRGIRRWRDAEAARRSLNERFVDDKAIVQLMDRGATPEQIHRWIIGASAAGAKPQAASVLGRLKDILGENHPSIEGIRQDFLYEMAAPLLDDRPNFAAFVRNVDRTVRNQPSLVKELGLQNSQIMQLRRFAKSAGELAPAGLGLDMARSLSQFFFGHQIARKGLIVRTMTFPIRAMMKILTGQSGGVKKQIIADLANANYSRPAIDPLSSAAGRAIEGAFWADIGGAAERSEDEAVGQ